MHTAELQLLTALQRAVRRQAMAAIDAALQGRHAGAIALVIARFADRRAALGAITDAGERAAIALRIDAEETTELARLALEHAAEKRQLRKATLAPLTAAHRAARRALRQRLRRQRAGIAVQLSAWRPTVSRISSARPFRRRPPPRDRLR